MCTVFVYLYTATSLNIQWTNSPYYLQCSHQYQEWNRDVPHMQYDLPLQQDVMEYHYPEVSMIQFSHVLVLYIHLCVKFESVCTLQAPNDCNYYLVCNHHCMYMYLTIFI